MPHCKSKDSIKRNLILTTVGISLQTAGSICLIASVIGISREIHQQIKRTVHNELLKYTEK